MKETWKPIAKFRGEYEVSNRGRIRSVRAILMRSNGSPHTRVSKVLKPALNHSGYYAGAVSLSGKLIAYCTHRIVAEVFLPKPDWKVQVNHKNCIKTDNRVENLEWVTHAENVRHACDNGLQKPRVGSLNGMAKLNEQQVREIRAHAANWPTRYYGREMLAKKYGVSICTIKEIVTRRKNKFYNA